jgi:hypothetical protein
MSIYVGNLSYDVTQEDLTSVFTEYGTVTRVQIPTDRETGRPRGFGFVEMDPNLRKMRQLRPLMVLSGWVVASELTKLSLAKIKDGVATLVATKQ